MAVYQVQPNGQAPPGLSVGDFVNTAGGMYQIAAPGTYGAVYNPASGYWSYKTNSDEYRIQSLINSAQSEARQNTMQSQDFAREQMAFQNTSAQKAMQFSAQQAQLQRDWQEGLSNTAHQREVRDLIAAGLNPILSAGGSGATTPSGASAAGIASSGAQGSVDTGGTQAATQLFTTLLNNMTNLDITKLQTAATMYAADRGFAGTQYSSNMNYKGTALTAKNQQFLQYQDQKFQDYLQREYPSADKAIVRAINDLTGFLTRVFTGENTSGRDYDEVVEAWFNLGQDLAAKFGSHGVGVKGNILNAVLSGEKGIFGDKYWDRYYENKAKKAGASYK